MIMFILSIVFWTLIVFASIAWYAFLLFYVGAKAGREIKAMTKTLEDRNAAEKKD
ncbi:MAG: hypothetical protein HY298_21135 [Verrucomicrobia bacterium]|nr:hypothetical protein [Verrucomicrobiota bacterium]